MNYQNLVTIVQDDFKKNPVELTDGYNLSHYELKEDVSWETAHIYNRARPMVVYGVNQILLNILTRQITMDMVLRADRLAKTKSYKMHFPLEMWLKVVEKFNGYVPLRVQLVPEGTWVPKGTPFGQTRNTIKGFGELPSWWECIAMHTYFSCGCATEALNIRKYLDANSLSSNRAHSFGSRGHRSVEDMHWASTAWNLFLTGTDDFSSLFYTPEAPMTSIPATAHKTIQQFDSEMDAYKLAIDVATTYEHRTVALVIDTYDPWRVIKDYISNIIQYAKEKNVHVVFRPDSGDVFEQTIAIWNLYKNHDNWSVILGEGMSLLHMTAIDSRLKLAGFPLSRFFVGMGSGYYNHIVRDWLGFSMKSAYSNFKPRMKIVKSNPFKQSIPGNVQLVRNDNGEIVVERDHDDKNSLYYDAYFYDGSTDHPTIKFQSWSDAYKNANIELLKPALQENIILSKPINDSIHIFHERYN